MLNRNHVLVYSNLLPNVLKVVNDDIETLLLNFTDVDKVSCKLDNETFATKLYLKEIYLSISLEIVDE